jgi:hypothetical protein
MLRPRGGGQHQLSEGRRCRGLARAAFQHHDRQRRSSVPQGGSRDGDSRGGQGEHPPCRCRLGTGPPPAAGRPASSSRRVIATAIGPLPTVPYRRITARAAECSHAPTDQEQEPLV